MIPFWIDSSSFGRPCKLHSPIYEKMTSWRCLTYWPVKLWRCKMTSLVNKSDDWTLNYHKILIFSPPKSLKRLRAARIDQLADSNEPSMIQVITSGGSNKVYLVLLAVQKMTNVHAKNLLGVSFAFQRKFQQGKIFFRHILHISIFTELQ